MLFFDEKFRQMNSLKEDVINTLKANFLNKYTVATTSFGLTSVAMIDLISKSKLKIPIIFIDTNFHFEETIEYKNIIVEFS